MKSSIHNLIDSIILDIYEAALEPEYWKDIALNFNKNLIYGTFEIACFNESTQAPALTVMDEASLDIQEEFLENYFHQDKRAPYLWASDLNKLLPWYELKDEPKLKGNDEFDSFAKRVDLENITSANLSIDRTKIFFTNARSRHSPKADREYFKAFEVLLPHIRKAIRLQLTLEGLKIKNNLLSSSWEVNNVAIFFLQNNNKVLFSNKFAESLISKQLYSLERKQLNFNNNQTNRVFCKILESIEVKFSQAMKSRDSFLAQDMAGNEYGVRIMPYLGDVAEINLVATNLTMVVITPLTGNQFSSPDDIHRFSQLYNLTEAEEQVVAAIAYDIELSDFSKTKNIKVDTARKQLKSALSKTGLRSQKQLVRLIDRFCFLNLK